MKGTTVAFKITAVATEHPGLGQYQVEAGASCEEGNFASTVSQLAQELQLKLYEAQLRMAVDAEARLKADDRAGKDA